MSKRPTIAVDCDDVIANINDAVRQFVNEQYGSNHTAADYRVSGTYRGYWERIWGIPEGELSDRFDKFVASGRMAHLEPVEGALDALAELKRTHRLILVTARPENQVEFTHTWLSANAPDLFEEVTFMHLWDKDDTKATKAQICRELGADFLIDDNYDHCRLAAEAGITALLFGDYGWNRTVDLLPNMIRVLNWHAVREYFNDQNGDN